MKEEVRFRNRRLDLVLGSSIAFLIAVVCLTMVLLVKSENHLTGFQPICGVCFLLTGFGGIRLLGEYLFAKIDVNDDGLEIVRWNNRKKYFKNKELVSFSRGTAGEFNSLYKLKTHVGDVTVDGNYPRFSEIKELIDAKIGGRSI